MLLERLITAIERDEYPPLTTLPTPSKITSTQCCLCFESQVLSRLLDITARELKRQGRGFYTISSSGHEGNVALGHVFPVSDIAFCHYRSGAFFIERARGQNHFDPVEAILLSLMGSDHDPISAGRHKVFGSVELNMPPQTSTIASHLPKAVGTAFSLNRAQELALSSPLSPDSVVLCTFGDASINHASAQSAFNTANWLAYQHYPVPIVFLCEDNGLGISVRTPRGWVKAAMQGHPCWHYMHADGLNLLDMLRVAKTAREIACQQKIPVFLHMSCVRLMGHAGSDIESVYLSEAEIERAQANDPLLYTAHLLRREFDVSSQAILDIIQTSQERVDKTLTRLHQPSVLATCDAVMSALIPKQTHAPKAAKTADHVHPHHRDGTPLTMSQMLNCTLADSLVTYDNAVVFGEDVGKKGGVYHVTADLQSAFGAKRVFDTLLDETSILGTAIGLAHNGFLPIPEIQFLAYLHNAIDQLRGEAATLSFFSDGQLANPMVLRLPSFAYQKGFGGHFHNDNAIAALREIPGLVMATPSCPAEASGLLKTCLRLSAEQQRICVLLEPIALYHRKDLYEAGDKAFLQPYLPARHVPFGDVVIEGEPSELCMVSFANGVVLARQSARVLEKELGVRIRLIDVRWLSPLPLEALKAAIAPCDKVLIIDETRRSGSPSEALMAFCVEQFAQTKRVHRVCAEDCFIPLGEPANLVLPSVASVTEDAKVMLKRKKEL